MPSGLKHLVKCNCVLPQFRKMKDPPQHQFVVFSVINDDNTVVQKFAQCPNCAAVHKVTDVAKSEVMFGKDNLASILTIDDVKAGMPDKVVAVLEGNKADLPSWEAVKFILETQQWGGVVVLNSEEVDGVRQGKYIQIMGENLFKIEPFSREEVMKVR